MPPRALVFVNVDNDGIRIVGVLDGLIVGTPVPMLSPDTAPEHLSTYLPWITQPTER